MDIYIYIYIYIYINIYINIYIYIYTYIYIYMVLNRWTPALLNSINCEKKEICIYLNVTITAPCHRTNMCVEHFNLTTYQYNNSSKLLHTARTVQ